MEMERDSDIFIYGVGVPDHKRIFGTTNSILEKFGIQRCFDTPIAEESMTGLALGASINGLRPIHVHIRVDFLLLAMNQIVNMISSFRYGNGGCKGAPIVIRAIVGRGWGQGFQHSKSMHGTFAKIPGLKVVCPTTPEDAKGLMIAAIRDDDPVLIFENRWLYWQVGDVPEGDYSIPLGQGKVLRPGNDFTIVATSWMNVEALHAARILSRHGIEVEIVDPRTISPLDEELIVRSVEKTGYCLVADNDWTYCGFSAEIAAIVSERCFERLKAPVQRVGFASIPCPTTRNLENEFYPNAKDLVRNIEKILGLVPIDMSDEKFYSHENQFKGPF
ncbi:acetoin dehydrogenase [Desulfosarcina ovata subsp. sediminis]|uniref:Acetoin dehydrogenase n=1 Tax=Desulfosarcina ovata subsp. sediminis TaxID=885957 RepID=A0A5K7ZMQ7_9BACT|nr:transketolase C-terminal domain-containing protein [Desulfosarcina ovata]BBO79770.1 acetoin dehydrogenase [Desulfosarcina ovata subsp. sediminis]